MSTVKVACKLPAGLTIDHTPKGGERATVTLKGASDRNARFGYGVTEVDADWFKSWTKEAGDFKPLAQGLIFVTGDDPEGAVRERASDRRVRHGAEALDPSKPAPGVEPTDEQKKELAKLPTDPADPSA